MHTHSRVKQPFKKGEALLSIPYELALDVTPSAPGGMTSRLVSACVRWLYACDMA